MIVCGQIPSTTQQLLKLRHPNILKFISSHSTHESIVMTTELVIPLSPVLSSFKFDGLVTGWRDLATGLRFLHDPVREKRGDSKKSKLYQSANKRMCVYLARYLGFRNWVSHTTTFTSATCLSVGPTRSGRSEGSRPRLLTRRSPKRYHRYRQGRELYPWILTHAW